MHGGFQTDANMTHHSNLSKEASRMKSHLQQQQTFRIRNSQMHFELFAIDFFDDNSVFCLQLRQRPTSTEIEKKIIDIIFGNVSCHSQLPSVNSDRTLHVFSVLFWSINKFVYKLQRVWVNYQIRDCTYPSGEMVRGAAD